MTTRELRQDTIRELEGLGYELPVDLPLIEGESVAKPLGEIASRLVSLHGVAAAASGFSREKTLAWIEANGARHSVSREELEFLKREPDSEPDIVFQRRVQSVYTLCWATGVVASFGLGTPCPRTLVYLLPDITKNEPAANFCGNLKLLDNTKLLRALDQHYCMTWVARNSELKRERLAGAVDVRALWERRHALEWLYSEESWDDVPLDT